MNSLETYCKYGHVYDSRQDECPICKIEKENKSEWQKFPEAGTVVGDKE